MAASTALMAPAAVIHVAVLAAGCGWLLAVSGLPPLVVGLVMVGLTSWLTRAIHLDGLADTADGLGSGRPAVRALEIMKQGDVGPMGVVTLIVTLGLQAACFASLLSRPWGALVAAIAICAGRGALAVVARRGVPAARPDGLGAVFASCLPVGAAAGLWVVLTVLLTGASVLAGGAWWQGPLAAGLAVAAVVYLVALAVRRLGGITGDVLGAAVELASTVLLVVLAR